MFAAHSKIRTPKGRPVTPFEESVAMAIFDLEINSAELKADLEDLFITAAKEVDLDKSGSKKAIVIFVPFPLLKRFHRIQTRLIRELEKKFSGRHVVFVAQRTIVKKPAKGKERVVQKRPHSRKLKSVQEAILEDLVYPTEIVGKRTRVRLDGSRLLKVYLDRTEQQNIEYKLDTFARVYKKLTNQFATFEFPVQQQE
eukprot:TRINITY_DN899_c0_g1_i1.p1 TRINITY_DN899_c0_g1~~TRINITY_DN899_c0_g1_i1.p1  ORF type:complete len:198 (-),score=38.40 TRINITY_DN899_c0_g1_i1:70-663(-)